VALSDLTASPFSLVQGDEVIVKARAYNSIGYSAYSAVSSGSALIVALPADPATSPLRNEATSTKVQIAVDMTAVTGDDTGGLPILSYKLEWNGGGAGSTYTALVGDSPDSIATSFT